MNYIDDGISILKPKNDYIFKRIFGDEKNSDILISFLESILKIHINKVSILNNELSKVNINDKKSILDVRATINDDTQIDIEIQLSRTAYFPERSLYYWAKMYSEQLNISEKYSRLQKTICINIVDFEVTEKAGYHSVYKIKEKDDNYLLTDLLEIHFLELAKLSKYSDNDSLYNWLKFISGDSREEMVKVAKTDDNIDKAFEILETISLSREERAAYLSREMALHDEATRLSEAEERGEERGQKRGEKIGEERGKKRKAIEIANNLLDILDDETIALITGLSIEEVKALRK